MTKLNGKLKIIFALFVVFCYSCKNKGKIPASDSQEVKTYLHISHTRTASNPGMDSVIEKINYDAFDMLWMGGDLAYLTSLDDNTMQHVDSIFDIGNVNTLWALGNHDYSDLDRVKAFTQRPGYYSYNTNGITIIVLDTQDSLSNIVGPQKKLFKRVTDTIRESSHLIILHHKLIWMADNDNLESLIASVSNGEQGDCFHCINHNNFYSEIYPELVKVKQRGIEVLCIGGDIGFRTNEFEHTTAEGICFMASGISYGKNNNKVLLFYHDLTNKKLTWEYKLTDDL